MSFSALNWAYEQPCPNGYAKSVLIYLANCANQQGAECWPSIATIAKRTQHAIGTVRKAIRELRSAGLVQVESRYGFDGGQGSNLYRLVMTPLSPADGGVASVVAPPYQETHIPPLPGTIENPSLEPEEEPRKEDSPLRVAPVAELFAQTPPDPKPGSDDDPGFAEFWNNYPRKDDKGHARKAWIKARRTTLPAEILAGLRGYNFSENPRFVPLPATWLNGERWLAAAEADTFDPVLRAMGLTPADFAGPAAAEPPRFGLLQ